MTELGTGLILLVI